MNRFDAPDLCINVCDMISRYRIIKNYLNNFRSVAIEMSDMYDL
jgi:hypothetical protein